MVFYWLYLKDGRELAGTNVQINDDNIIFYDYMRKGKKYDKKDIIKVIESKTIRGNKKDKIIL